MAIKYFTTIDEAKKYLTLIEKLSISGKFKETADLSMNSLFYEMCSFNFEEILIKEIQEFYVINSKELTLKYMHDLKVFLNQAQVNLGMYFIKKDIPNDFRFISNKFIAQGMMGILFKSDKINKNHLIGVAIDFIDALLKAMQIFENYITLPLAKTDFTTRFIYFSFSGMNEYLMHFMPNVPNEIKPSQTNKYLADLLSKLSGIEIVTIEPLLTNITKLRQKKLVKPFTRLQVARALYELKKDQFEYSHLKSLYQALSIEK